MLKGYQSMDREGGAATEKRAVRLFSEKVDSAQAGEWMLNSGSTPGDSSDVAVAECVELDMGMGSRVEGFRICGHR